VGHQGVGEGKGPERLTEDGRQCHGGMPGVGRGSGVVGRYQIGNLGGQVVDLSREVLESRRYVNAGPKRGAK